MLNLQYAYLIGDLVLLFPIWLILFIKRKDLRNEMLSFGTFVGILTVIFEYFYFSRDYWSPKFILGTYAGIEDFLFGFFSFGIAATLYEVFYGITFAKRKNRKHHWKAITVVLIGMFLFLFHILTTHFAINSIYSLIFISTLTGIVIITYRHDLLKDTLYSGVFFGTFYFFVFLMFDLLFPKFVHQLYFLGNLSGLQFGGFPIEETIWGISWGFVMGPTYEFYQGMKLKSK